MATLPAPVDTLLDAKTALPAVLAASLDPLVAIDVHGTVQFVSDSVERVFGWKPAESNISAVGN